MAIVLGVSLIITYITTLGMKLKEGIDSTLAESDPTAAANLQAKKTTITTTPASTTPPTTTTTTTTPTTTTATPTTTTPPTDLSSTVSDLKSSLASMTGTGTATTAEPSGTTEPMNVMSNKKRNRIDYASTVQDAYEDLNSMLGQDGIKGLTLDTNRLIEQQAQLASAMKNMTPLVKTAKELLNGFNFEGMNDISNMAKQFMPSK